MGESLPEGPLPPHCSGAFELFAGQLQQRGWGVGVGNAWGVIELTPLFIGTRSANARPAL